MLQIHSDWSEVERELDRLERAPSQKDRQVLKGVLNVGFASTQAVVHTESGALKASGQTDTSYSKLDHRWEGEISYGEDEGPVDYAIYEKRRGVHWVGDSAGKGDHDFMRPLETLGPLWVATIKGVLRP